MLFKHYGKVKSPTLGLIYQYPFFGELMSISDEQFYLGHYKTAGKTKPFTLELKISPEIKNLWFWFGGLYVIDRYRNS